MSKHPKSKSRRSQKPVPTQGIPAWIKCLLLVIGCLLLFTIIRFSSVEVTQSPTEPAPAKPDPILATSSQLPTIPGLEDHRFDSVVRGVAEREDPVIDGWDSERFSEVANQQLKNIGKLLTHPEEINGTEMGKIASDSYTGSHLRPLALESVFQDKSLEVVRGQESEASSSGTEGLDGFAKDLRRLVEPLQGLDDQRYKFKIISVEQSEDSTETTAIFQISGRTEDRAVQINAKWHCDWQNTSDQQALPKLSNISVSDYEEVTYTSKTGSMFSDCTESVFSGTDRFERQLIYGIDHWTDRFDGAIARPAAGHGIAIADVNGDGLEDLYLCQPPGLPNLLLLQNADGTVTDKAVEANVNWLEGTRAALFADLDNDGDQDLVAVLGNQVVIQANDGSGVFEVKTIVSTVSSLFAINALDYDNDKDLDLFICGYTLSSGVDLNDVFANPMPFHDANNGAPNVMLRSEGNWNYTDVTKELGLDENNSRFSYASSWDDFDGDGDLDGYVANDFGRNNLYRNDNGRFKDVAPEADVEDIGPGMSAAWGDYNNDGRPDIYVSNMFSSAGSRITRQKQFKTNLDETEKQVFRRHARGNSLFENLGGGEFKDQSIDLGVTLGRWAWGSLFVDLNNDGWEDLYVTNGFITADNNNDL